MTNQDISRLVGNVSVALQSVVGHGWAMSVFPRFEPLQGAIIESVLPQIWSAVAALFFGSAADA
jgi:hypothetical protein